MKQPLIHFTASLSQLVDFTLKIKQCNCKLFLETVNKKYHTNTYLIRSSFFKAFSQPIFPKPPFELFSSRSLGSCEKPEFCYNCIVCYRHELECNLQQINHFLRTLSWKENEYWAAKISILLEGDEGFIVTETFTERTKE